MSAGDKIIKGAREALAVARGEVPAASITVNGHTYVPRLPTTALEPTTLAMLTRRIHQLEEALDVISAYAEQTEDDNDEDCRRHLYMIRAEAEAALKAEP